MKKNPKNLEKIKKSDSIVYTVVYKKARKALKYKVFYSPAKGVGWIKPARGFKSLLPRQWKCFIYSQIKHFHFFTAVFVLKKFCFRVVFKTITPKFTPKAHFYYTKNSVRKIFLVEFFYAFCLLLQKIMRNLLRKFAFLSRLFFYISAFCIIVIISFWGNLLFKKNFY